MKHSLIIQLEFNGKIIHEISSDDLKSDITIGRNDQCTWQVPREDRSASGVHARIFRMGAARFSVPRFSGPSAAGSCGA